MIFFIHFGVLRRIKRPKSSPLVEESPSGDWPFMGNIVKVGGVREGS